jgi:hypothetical protein
MSDSASDPSDARVDQGQPQGDETSTTESATHDSPQASDAGGTDEDAAVETDTGASQQAIKAEQRTPQKQSKAGAGDQEEDEEDDEEDENEDDEDEEEDDSDEEDEEPRLKYARLTQHLGPVYRNGDATSSFLVASDKMVCAYVVTVAYASFWANFNDLDCWHAQRKYCKHTHLLLRLYMCCTDLP